jgi:quercetin dioxygenase-like cupin family protein
MELGVVLWKEPHKPKIDDIERSMRSEGYATCQWSDPPGARYESHQHEHDELIWIIGGRIEFMIDEKVYELNAGDRLFLPRDTPHEAQVPRGQKVEYLIGQK